MIDDLVYSYTGNRVTKIDDNPTGVSNPSGYEGGGGTIQYDINGNMTVMPDKGITNISYNFLNLPTSVSQRGNETKYTYRADGTKLKRTFTLNNSEGSNTTTTEYFGGFNYTPSSAVVMAKALEQTDESTVAVRTAGQEEIFQDSSVDINAAVPQPQLTMLLSFFPTSEGFYDYRNKQYIYQYKDQVGNIRLSYAKNAISNEVEVVDRNDYYPFGLNFHEGAEFSVTGSPLNYKFGGKELQESGFYDFGARNYMPDVGRWFGADPLAELAPDMSPYRYAFNNPISFTDPTGMYEDNYGGGDYYDDSDREPDAVLPYFHLDTGVCGDCESLRKDLEHISDWKIDFSFGYGGESGDGAYNDFMADMSHENGSDMGSHDAGLEQNCCPDLVYDVARGFSISASAVVGTIGYVANSIFSSAHVPDYAGTRYLYSSTGSFSISDVRTEARSYPVRERMGQVGSYTITFDEGYKYHGKGPINRMFESALFQMGVHQTTVKSFDWTPSISDREAFKAEYNRMQTDQVLPYYPEGYMNPRNYNIRQSPGYLYKLQDGY